MTENDGNTYPGKELLLLLEEIAKEENITDDNYITDIFKKIQQKGKTLLMSQFNSLIASGCVESNKSQASSSSLSVKITNKGREIIQKLEPTTDNEIKEKDVMIEVKADETETVKSLPEVVVEEKIEKIIKERGEIVMKNLTDFQKRVIKIIEEMEEEWVEKDNFKKIESYNPAELQLLVTYKITEEGEQGSKIKLTGYGKKVAGQIIEKEKEVDIKTIPTENPTTPNIISKDKIPILAETNKQNQTTAKNPVKWQVCLTNIGEIFDEAKREKILNPEVKRKLGERGMKSPDNHINKLVELGFITKTIPPGTDVSVIEITDKGFEFLTEPEKFSDIQPYAKSSKPIVTPKTDEPSETQEKLKTENVKMEEKHPISESARMKCLAAIAKIIAENENQPVNGLYSKLEARGIKSMGYTVPLLITAGLVKKTGNKRHCLFELTELGKEKAEKFAYLLDQPKEKINGKTPEIQKFSSTNDLKSDLEPKPDLNVKLNIELKNTLLEPLSKIVQIAAELIDEAKKHPEKNFLSEIDKVITVAYGLNDIMKKVVIFFPENPKLEMKPPTTTDDFREPEDL